MGYVAMKSRLINGTRYMAGDPVDTSEWEPALIGRMEERRRIIWVPEGNAPDGGDVETGTATLTLVQDDDAITYTGDVATMTMETARREVYHVGFGYYHRVDTGEKVPHRGKKAIKAAGFTIVDAPPGAE